MIVLAYSQKYKPTHHYLSTYKVKLLNKLSDVQSLKMTKQNSFFLYSSICFQSLNLSTMHTYHALKQEHLFSWT